MKFAYHCERVAARRATRDRRVCIGVLLEFLVVFGRVFALSLWPKVADRMETDRTEFLFLAVLFCTARLAFKLVVVHLRFCTVLYRTTGLYRSL